MLDIAKRLFTCMKSLQFEHSLGNGTGVQLINGSLVILQGKSTDSQFLVLQIPKSNTNDQHLTFVLFLKLPVTHGLQQTGRLGESEGVDDHTNDRGFFSEHLIRRHTRKTHRHFFNYKFLVGECEVVKN